MCIRDRFSFKVRATGEIYESGVAISDMLTYINKWPHIKWLLTVDVYKRQV